jgi:hypothetical protein
MGQPVTAPAVEQLRAVEAAQLRLEAVLGIGPAYRHRIGIVAERAHEPDALDELQARRQRRLHGDQPQGQGVT